MPKATAQNDGPVARSIREGTRQRIVEAALQTLKDKGFAATSARAIATTGSFNQALVFYHFGTVNDLLLAALDRSSEARMGRYRAAVDDVHSLPELLRVAAEVYREDLSGDHVMVLAELITGASSAPELGPQIAARLEPWIAFTEEAITRVLGESPLAGVVPSRDLAFGIVSLYLGAAMLTRLAGDRSGAESLVASGVVVAGLLGSVLDGGR
jgi:AcrR family transcriptional regulator